MSIQLSRPCKECWRVKSGVKFDFVVFPLLTGDFKVKRFPSCQSLPNSSSWETLGNSSQLQWHSVIMCSYQPIGGQYYQVSKAKYILATLQKVHLFSKSSVIQLWGKEKKKNCKIPGFFERRNAGMLHSPIWSSVEVCLSIRGSRDPGAKLFFFCENGQRNFLRSLFVSKWSPEAEIRSRQEGNKLLIVHPITNI